MNTKGENSANKGFQTFSPVFLTELLQKLNSGAREYLKEIREKRHEEIAQNFFSQKVGVNENLTYLRTA